MKKILAAILSAVMLLVGIIAMAEGEEKNYAPEPGTGWMNVEIHGTPEQLSFTDLNKGMTGTTYTFESDHYTIKIVFDRKLAVGEEMGANSINQIEIISNKSDTEGYYLTKKSTSNEVDSTVLLEKDGTDGIWQGTFRVTVHPTDRYVGDMRPGIIDELMLENGEFCFCE